MARNPTDLSSVTDEQLRRMLDNAIADYALATRYEHNAPAVPYIRLALDLLHTEMRRRKLDAG